MPKGQSLETRFYSRVAKDPTTGCWNWIGSKDVDGYGVIWTRERNNNERAHRVSLRLANKEVRETEMVLHQCDNPSCVNPEHLTTGDNRQNQIEAVERGLATDHTNKRIAFYKSMTEEDFQHWKKRFIGRKGRARANLTFAENARRK